MNRSFHMRTLLQALIILINCRQPRSSRLQVSPMIQLATDSNFFNVSTNFHRHPVRVTRKLNHHFNDLDLDLDLDLDVTVRSTCKRHVYREVLR